MLERAMEEMERALALSAELHTARLQLALLYLGAQRVEDARRVLQPLQELAPDHALHHFGFGLQYLMQDRFAECRAALEQGIALNVENPALNTDMGKLLDALPALDGSQAPPPGGNVWLSAYRRDAGPN
jgi:tetratricopeptide (TPR) repeat protein